MLTTEQIDEIRDSFAGLDAIPSRATVQRIATLASPMLAASAAPAEGRQSFEAWVKRRGGDVMKRDGDYISSMTREWWSAWTAALATAPTMSDAARDTKRLDWLMSQVCCDDFEDISIELNLTREQHYAEFRRQIDSAIERIDRAAAKGGKR